MSLRLPARLSLDTGFLALVVVFGAAGIVGLTATANIKPNFLTAPTCNCLPSPLIRIQELCVVLLAIAIILIPVGMMLSTDGQSGEGGGHEIPPDFRGVLPSGRRYEGPPIQNGGKLVLGVALVVLGIGVISPSILLLKNPLLGGEGVVMILLGIFFILRGGSPT